MNGLTDRYLLDTNVLLRLALAASFEHDTLRRCIDLLWARRSEIFYTSQNLAEFWNVCTRPTAGNGYGMAPSEANRLVILLEREFRFAPDSELTHAEWRSIVVDESVSGVQVHDARLVAAMRVHRIPHLVTFNTRDFRRYRDIDVISPVELLVR